MVKKKKLKVRYAPEQEALLARLREDLAVQLERKPKRLAHSLSVARTAERLALLYGVDPFLASAAGILEEYERLAVARGERPRYRVSRVVGDERIRLEVVRAQDGARIAVEAGATGTVRAAEEEMEL